MDRVTIKLSKLEIAKIQLNRAIILFLSGEDYVSAITLAGASEEILGKLLKNTGLTNSLEDLVEESQEYQVKEHGEASNKKDIVSLANYYRDRLKHINDGKDLLFSVDYEAAYLIDRAISNYFKITGDETREMISFRELDYFGE
ncbi:MAG TPA: hypothetical protein ENK04_15715 [Gammaproteobacteria bacterium]|nr:hypothetical protein [Gammaproteobacteria bacterium]